MDAIEVGHELRRVRAEFHELAQAASADDLTRRSNGTRWTNRQLLFHMVFGYLVVRTLMPLVHALGRLGHSRGFAATLNARAARSTWSTTSGPASAATSSPPAPWPPCSIAPSAPCNATSPPRPSRAWL